MRALATRASEPITQRRAAATVTVHPLSAPPPPDPGEFLDKFQVAALLGVHFSTVERLIKTDALPVVRLGPADRRQTLRFRRAALDTWLRSREDGAK